MLKLCGVAFSVNVSNQMAAPIIALYAKESLHASIGEVGLVISAYFLASLSSKLPLGMLGQRTRVSWVLPASTFLMILSPVGYALAPDTQFFTGIRVLHGLAFALFGISGMILSSLASKERDRAVAAYTSALALGLMAGPGVGSLAVPFVGIKGIFLISVIPAAAAVMLALSIKIKAPPPIPTSTIELFKHSRRVVSDRKFQSSFIAYFAFSFVLGVLLAYAPIYARQAFDLTDAAITALFFGYFTVTASTRLVMTRIIHSMSLAHILLIGLMNAAFVVFFMPLMQLPQFFGVAFVLLGLSHGVVYPASAMILVRAFKQGELFLASSIYLTGFDLGGMLGPALMSLVATTLGLQYAISMSAVVPLVAAALVASSLRRK